MAEREAAKRLAAAAAVIGEGGPDTGSARSAIPSFIVMDVMRAALAAEVAGRSIMHMEVGQPGTPAPRAARQAAARALEAETLGYTMALGNDALRAAIAQHYADWYGVNVAPERIAVTTGSSAAFVLAFLAVFDAGDAVALPSPGYPATGTSLVRSGSGRCCSRRGLQPIGCRAPRMLYGRCAAMPSRGC